MKWKVATLMTTRNRTLVVRVVVSLVFVGLVAALAVSLSRLKTARMVVDEVLLGSGITILMEESNYCLDQVRVKEGTGYDPTAALLDLAEDAAVISQNLYALDPVFSDLSGSSDTIDRYHLGDRETRAVFSEFFRQYHDYLMEDVQSIQEKLERGEEVTQADLPGVSAFCLLLTSDNPDFIGETIRDSYQTDWGRRTRLGGNAA